MSRIFWDTETALFREGCMAPPLTCVSYCTEAEEPQLLSWRDAPDWFIEHARAGDVFVGHNVAYDFAVLAAEFPRLVPEIFRVYEQDQVTDTMLRQFLLDNATGRLGGEFRQVQRKDKAGKVKTLEVWFPIRYSLDDTLFRASGKRLDKDTFRLKYGSLRNVPLEEWEEGARTYPREDARATRTVCQWQDGLSSQIQGCYLSWRKGHIQDPQPLADEFRQARAAWWIQLMSVWGIRTDADRVRSLSISVNLERKNILKQLQSTGLVRADGTRDIKKAAERMVKVMGSEERCKRTDSGGIKLDEEACKDSEDPVLISYAEYTSLGTVLNKDIPALLRGEVTPIHSYFRSFVASGRTSSSSPNLQNIRRLPGIRECFVPRPGMVFLDADYDGLELRTLAQVCMTLLGKSKLAELLNSGADPHLEVAAKVLKIDYHDAQARKKQPDVAQARQLGKVANFGFPGGLGFKTLVQFAKGYGATLTEDEARILKQDWLRAFPEMKDYFEMIAGHVGESGLQDDDLANVEQVFSKRLRGGATYTAACNSYFQGLGADATKAAGFLLAKECYVKRDSPLFGCRVVNYIHDQFIVECVPERAHEAAMRLARVMEEGAAPFLPDVPPKVSEPVVCKFWSKNAQQVFDEEGRLVPWPLDAD
jgi:DNA polymerase-1